MNIPTLPTKAAGQVVDAADLNSVASACTFLLGKPIGRIRDATGGLALNTGYQLVTYTNKDFDTDSMWSSGSPTHFKISTAGWYKARYSIQVAASSGGRTVNTRVRIFSGPNNPLGNGIVVGNALEGYIQQNATTSVTSFAGASGLIPYYLYPGDQVAVLIAAESHAGTTGADASMPLSSLSIEFVSA